MASLGTFSIRQFGVPPYKITALGPGTVNTRNSDFHLNQSLGTIKIWDQDGARTGSGTPSTPPQMFNVKSGR